VEGRIASHDILDSRQSRDPLAPGAARRVGPCHPFPAETDSRHGPLDWISRLRGAVTGGSLVLEAVPDPCPPPIGVRGGTGKPPAGGVGNGSGSLSAGGVGNGFGRSSAAGCIGSGSGPLSPAGGAENGPGPPAAGGVGGGTATFSDGGVEGGLGPFSAGRAGSGTGPLPAPSPAFECFHNFQPCGCIGFGTGIGNK